MKKFTWIAAAVFLTTWIALTGCASKNSVGSSSAGSTTIAPSSSSVSAASAAKVFTLSELKQYNGQNGKPAYIAVSGVVYDVTNANGWSGGTHHGYSAGQDLTGAIQQSPHGTAVLQGLPVVGKLK